jgi:hypothetical protein
MIGGGNRIGGNSGLPEPKVDPSGAALPKGGQESQPRQLGDRFEKAPPGGQERSGPQAASEAPGRADLMTLNRDPAASTKRLGDSLSNQARALLGDIEREQAQARLVADKLVSEKFTKAARDKVAKELRKRREAIGSLKERYRATLRKLGQMQHAGVQLGARRLDRDIEKISAQHAKFRTDWGRRLHLLGSADSLLGPDDETVPDFLRETVSAQVEASQQAGEVLHALSPQRALSELAARTLDGSSREPSLLEAVPHADKGGRSAQAAAMLAELTERSVSRDPFAKG